MKQHHTSSWCHTSSRDDHDEHNKHERRRGQLASPVDQEVSERVSERDKGRVGETGRQVGRLSDRQTKKEHAEKGERRYEGARNVFDGGGRRGRRA